MYIVWLWKSPQAISISNDKLQGKIMNSGYKLIHRTQVLQEDKNQLVAAKSSCIPSRHFSLVVQEQILHTSP